MKKHRILTLGLAISLLTSAEAGQQQLAASIKEARLEATRAGEQLKAGLDALTTLSKQKEGDLRPAFNVFTAEVSKTEAAAAWTRARVNWMNGDGQKYFQTWQKTIDSMANESLRKQAQKRMDAAKKNYDKVAVALAAAADRFQPFLSDLTDIQKALGTDVTAAGVKAVKGTVSDANWRYQSVSAAVKDAAKQMEKMEKALSTEAK